MRIPQVTHEEKNHVGSQRPFKAPWEVGREVTCGSVYGGRNSLRDPPNRLPLMVSAQSCVTSPPPPPTAVTSFGKRTGIPALGLDQLWFRITLYNQ